MTLDDAITQARAIQRDLDEGLLAVPYPPDVRAKLDEIITYFTERTTDAQAAELVRRLMAAGAEMAVEMELPW